MLTTQDDPLDRMNDALDAPKARPGGLQILSLIPTARRPVSVALDITPAFNRSNAQNLDGVGIPVDLDARADGQSDIIATLGSLADREP